MRSFDQAKRAGSVCCGRDIGTGTITPETDKLLNEEASPSEVLVRPSERVPTRTRARGVNGDAIQSEPGGTGRKGAGRAFAHPTGRPAKVRWAPMQIKNDHTAPSGRPARGGAAGPSSDQDRRIHSKTGAETHLGRLPDPMPRGGGR